MKRKSFVQGAVVLGSAGVLIKLMGAFFRIPLGNLIGTEGMAYYQMSYAFYVLFLTLSTAGIPIAISQMVSERVAVGRYYEAHRIFRISLIWLLCVGVLSAAALFFGAEKIAQLVNLEQVEYSLIAIAPALIFVPIMAAYRGYFQGRQDMHPTAVSQVTEQLFRVVAGLSLAYILLHKGKAFAAAGASFGATAGAVGGFGCMIILYFLARKKLWGDIRRTRYRGKAESATSILRKILLIVIPVAIGASIMPIMNAIDSVMVLGRLQDAGWSNGEAKALYGQLTGFAGSLIGLPQVFTQAVAMSLVPAITVAYQQKDTTFLHYNLKLSFRIAMLVGLPCAFGMMTLSEPIMVLLYPFQKASAVGAASCLFVMAFGIIFLSTVQTLTGALQGLGKPMIPVRNLFIGAIVKVILTYILTGFYEINVKGAAIGTVTAYIVASILNICAVKRLSGVSFDVVLTYVKPIASTLAMGAVAWFSYHISYGYLGNTFSTIIAIILGIVVYSTMILMTKAITDEELRLLPKGTKIAGMANKFSKK
ncbi:polysaccharide biosynthesis protein [Aminipila butyrica]|uniref:Polysaccharide biosynthesis protein n=1 Tax=Aminipila butyrica TaxID=433296 RepID=A0A858BWJ6_9FIRM|nr:polysaccharide biosynthesis protein [Aminipila butyrica]QIB70303.1 polysaccharide biosynthesis protein [Aminipila butyrica]